MSLLNKFAAVEIKADNRISEEDKVFCLHQQDAFDKSGPALQKIAEMIVAAKAEQQEALGVDDGHFYNPYMTGDGFRCDEEFVFKTMKQRNSHFISAIVDYFANKYNVKLDSHEIKEHLIPVSPKEPQLPWGGYKSMSDQEIDSFKKQMEVHRKEREKYEMNLRALPLRYEQIVDEIFVQLGGFSFQEQAMNEFLERTWNCCHRYREDKEEFEIKNDTLRLTGYWCRCKDDSWRSYDEWESTDSLKTLLNAVAYFECGRMDEGYLWFPELFKYDTQQNQFDTRNMSKVKSIKLFKNGRVDIKFRNAAYVQEFVEQYMRRRVA